VRSEGDLLHVVTAEEISDGRRAFGRALIWGSFALLAALVAVQALDSLGYLGIGFPTWRPTLYAYVAWGVCLCWGQVILHGERGKRLLFVLPAALFTVSMVVVPAAVRAVHRADGLESRVHERAAVQRAR
jgi:multiple sugar transport system permease protein